MKNLERLRWRSRRGLLELDILLQPFVINHYAKLNETEKLAYERLLDLPDNTLWDMLTGRKKNDDVDETALLEKIKAM